jgi:hypothetical protein
MRPPTSANFSPRASPRIACYGTAFIADAPIDPAALLRGIAYGMPQFSSPRLDASFLVNCGRFLTGKVASMEETPSTYVKRIASTNFHSSRTTLIYECSSELHELLAALSADRATEIAIEWYHLYSYAPAKTKPLESNGRTERRLAILRNLSALAKQGKDCQARLILRVECRKRRLMSVHCS